MGFWVVFLCVLTVANMGFAGYLTRKIIKAVKESLEADRSRAVYKYGSDTHITVFRDSAYLEGPDGKVRLLERSWTD